MSVGPQTTKASSDTATGRADADVLPGDFVVFLFLLLDERRSRVSIVFFVGGSD